MAMMDGQIFKIKLTWFVNGPLVKIIAIIDVSGSINSLKCTYSTMINDFMILFFAAAMNSHRNELFTICSQLFILKCKYSVVTLVMTVLKETPRSHI